MKITRFLIVGNAVFVLLLLAQIAVRPAPPQGGVTMMATWAERPPDVESTTELADSVISARVVKIRKSALTVDAPGEPGGKDSIPVEVITLQVTDDDIKGKKKKGDTIELFHTGHSGEKGEGHNTLFGDPAYKVGEEYVLFVREGPTLKVDGQAVQTQAIISPEGRWKIDQNRNAQPISDMDWAKKMWGKPSKALKDRAAKAHAAAKAGKGKLKKRPKGE